MGLDMYLRLKEHSKCSVKGFGGDGDTYHRDPKDWVCVTKEYAVCDWRKPTTFISGSFKTCRMATMIAVNMR